MEKLIITAALNGGSRTKEENSSVPLTVDEVIKDAIACEKAGAAIVHIHGRDPISQKSWYDTDYYCRIAEGIREQSGILINFSTAGHTEDPYECLNALTAKPDLCSLNVGSSEANEMEFTKRIYESGTKANIECCDLGHIHRAKQILESKYYSGPLILDILVNVYESLPFTIQDLLYLVEKLPSGAIWTTVGGGTAGMRMAALAIAAGGHVRVGVEDDNCMPSGEPATNVKHVERIARLARELGREIAGPSEARMLIGIPNMNAYS